MTQRLTKNLRRYDHQHNDIQHNNVHYNGFNDDAQHNNGKNNIMLSVTFFIVVMIYMFQRKFKEMRKKKNNEPDVAVTAVSRNGEHLDNEFCY